jgi:hypothetical protein
MEAKKLISHLRHSSSVSETITGQGRSEALDKSKQADLDAQADWYADRDSDAVAFTSLREALVHAMAVPIQDRNRDAVIVTAGAERYGWDAIELIHHEARTAGKL